MTSDNDVYSPTFESRLDPHFEGWSEGEAGWSEAGRKRAMRRYRFWQSKGKRPEIGEVLRQCNAVENASLRASEDRSHADT